MYWATVDEESHCPICVHHGEAEARWCIRQHRGHMPRTGPIRVRVTEILTPARKRTKKETT